MYVIFTWPRVSIFPHVDQTSGNAVHDPWELTSYYTDTYLPVVTITTVALAHDS